MTGGARKNMTRISYVRVITRLKMVNRDEWRRQKNYRSYTRIKISDINVRKKQKKTENFLAFV